MASETASPGDHAFKRLSDVVARESLRAAARPIQSLVLALSHATTDGRGSSRFDPRGGRDAEQKVGGPPVHPPIPAEVMAGQSVPGQGWPTSSRCESARRSVFVHVKRSLTVPILATHDAADTDLSCPVRYTTTVPTQALGLLNGAFANEQAAQFAERLRREGPESLERQVQLAIRLTTGREPDQDDVRRDVVFLKSLASEGGLDHRDALTQYCLMILNTNAFLYLD